MYANDAPAARLMRASWLYLLLPFALFCAGWVRFPISILLIGGILAVFRSLWRDSVAACGAPPPRLTPAVLLFAAAWVLLSGVGGYAFQNYDFHGRNAILRDLIEYPWPVTYSDPDRGPLTMLVYYIGYWLPAALAGKLFGWPAANGFLFLWTVLGVLLVILHLGALIRTSAIKAALLLAGFSGLDALGTALFAAEYPTLWPPVQHLEIWSGILQYSSFTTQLYWVFNQAVPAWLCIVLFLTPGGAQEPARDGRGLRMLAWSLCFFFAPLIAVGLLPFLVLDWFGRPRAPGPGGFRRDLFLAGSLIAAVSLVYFASNAAAGERGLQSPGGWVVLRFVLLEAGPAWLLLLPLKRRDPRWILAGLLLAAAPFVQIGGERDFVMRASIAPLFLLMTWCGEALSGRGTPRWARAALLTLILAGSLTPLYEVNRSLVRTFEYYVLLGEDQRIRPDAEPAEHLEPGGAPEAEHPGALLADELHTLAFLDDRLARNYIANVRKSLYDRWIAPR